MKRVWLGCFLIMLLTPILCFSASLTPYEHAWKSLSEKQYQSALNYFNESIKTLPADQKWLALDGKAWVAYYQGDYANAKKQFSSVLAEYPYAYLSHKGLGYIYLKQKAWADAYAELNLAFEQAPLQPVSDYIYAINAFINATQYSYAKLLLQRAEYHYPQSGDVKFYAAKILWLQDKKAQAYPIILTASYYSPTTVSALLDSLKGLDVKNIKPALLYMGWGLYVDGYSQAALYRFNQYLKLDPQDLNALRGKGFCLVKLGQFAAGQKILFQVVNDKRNLSLPPVLTHFYAKNKQDILVYTDAAVMLGWAEYGLSHYKRADSLFYQVLNKHPDWINARLGMAHVMKAMGNKEYQREIEIIDAQAPGYTILPEVAPHELKLGQQLYTQGWTNVFAKKYDQARMDFTRAEKLLPTDQKWLAQDGNAWIAYYQEHYAVAARQFKKIIASNQAAYLSYKGLAYIQMQEKRYDLAIKNLQRSLAINPIQGADVYSYAAKTFASANRFSDVNALANQGLRYYPNSGDLLFYKARILWSQGHQQAAYPLLLKASYFAPLVVNAELNTLPGLDVSKIKGTLLNMGWGLYTASQYQAALVRFDQYYALIAHQKTLSLDDLNAIRGQGYCYVSLQHYNRAQKKLSQVVKNPLASQLPPVTSHFLTTHKKYVAVRTDAQTMLGWAQLSLNHHSAAKKNFNTVLKGHSTWVNAKLGLAHALRATGRENESAAELKNINDLAPGYGQIYLPPEPFPLTTTVQTAYAGFGNNSAKRNAKTTQISLSYAPNKHVQMGGNYNYQYILFKPIADTSPKNNSRWDYFLNLYTPHITVIDGYMGITTKGNYIAKSAYNDAGIDDRLIPYAGIAYKSANQLNTVEMGYARQRLNDLIKTGVDQYSISLNTLQFRSWMFGLTAYYINVNSITINHTERFFSVQPSVTYFIGPKQDISAQALIGRRKQAYDLMLNKVYDIRDREIGGGGLTYTYHFNKHLSLFVDTSAERFILDSDTTKRYWAYYLTTGVII